MNNKLPMKFFLKKKKLHVNHLCLVTQFDQQWQQQKTLRKHQKKRIFSSHNEFPLCYSSAYFESIKWECFCFHSDINSTKNETQYTLKNKSSSFFGSFQTFKLNKRKNFSPSFFFFSFLSENFSPFLFHNICFSKSFSFRISQLLCQWKNFSRTEKKRSFL